MFKPFSVFVGSRNTRAGRRGFVSFISVLSMLGMVLGVAAMITVLSVMNGFDYELKQRILGIVPHVTITSEQGFDDWQSTARPILEQAQVDNAAPFTQGQAMLSRHGTMHGVMVTGVVPEFERSVSILASHMVGGRLSDLQPGSKGIVLGDLLARGLGVTLGDKLTVLVPEAQVSSTGGAPKIVPKLTGFEVVGVFRVGAEVDSIQAFVHLGDAGSLFGYQAGQAQGIRLQLSDWYAAGKTSRQLESLLPDGSEVSNWTISHGSLFSAIKLEKTMVSLLLLLIVAVAAFNIVATLIMMVTEKQADIAILRAMGASAGQVMRVFVVQGMIIGLLGTVCGVILGVTLALNIAELVAWFESVLGLRVFDPQVYFISRLPAQLQWGDVIMIGSLSFVLSLVATLYPSWRAARVEPAQALRYE